MIKVRNQKVIRELSRNSLKANKMRNIMACVAIVLTTMLFTSLFTTASTLMYSFQQQTFRQVGGDPHGSFKYLSEEQLNKLKQDTVIKGYGTRLLLAIPDNPPFNKVHVELSYMDAMEAKMCFCKPEEGRMPKEGTKEFTCDTRILKLLKIEPKLGTKVEIPYKIGSEEVKDTFTLVGWWEHDEVSSASFINLPLSYVEEQLSIHPERDYEGVGTWGLDVYFKNAKHIERDLEKMAERHGYQINDPKANNFLEYGVNWGYIGAQISQKMDPQSLVFIIVLLIVFFLTGYLIIYNIFQISVVNDIKFYGLLKTIGTTRRQIRSIIYKQAFMLSGIGIPVGLVLGYFFGKAMTPVIMSTLTYKRTYYAVNPFIFIGGAIFSLITVFISCRKPGKIAGKVSPVEAVKYTEEGIGKKKVVERKKNSITNMALEGLGRNRKKTILVVLSMSLAVVLLQGLYIFTKGFDIDKFACFAIPSDFMIGDAAYFQDSWGIGDYVYSLSEENIADIKRQNGIERGGRIYGVRGDVYDFVTEEWLRDFYEDLIPEENMDEFLANKEKNEEGLVRNGIQIYGMEEYPLSLLTVIEGDLKALNDPEQNAIAAIYDVDDYGQMLKKSQWAKLGDKVKLQYEDSEEEKEVTYTVTALVALPHPMGYRFYSANQFILNADVFKRDNMGSQLMSYMFDVSKEKNKDMEAYLKAYSENEEPTLDYESKKTYLDEFNGFRNMFVFVGSALCGIVGFVGILNFLNAVITSIMTRKHEFAVMRSIGMTARQLRKMLIIEGIWYGVLSMICSIVLSLLLMPAFKAVLNSMFYFVTPKFTVVPFLIVAPIYFFVGVAVPYGAYKLSVKDSIVEQLRAVE